MIGFFVKNVTEDLKVIVAHLTYPKFYTYFATGQKVRMNNVIFIWLQRWYKIHCNGDWEHSYGIQIDTLDNPGWTITIDLQDTDLHIKNFEKITIKISYDTTLLCF